MNKSATNLSYLYLVEEDLTNADKYASIALSIDQYNSSAKINKGNVYYLKGNYLKAKQFYLEVINFEADNLDALFNLALSYRKLN